MRKVKKDTQEIAKLHSRIGQLEKALEIAQLRLSKLAEQQPQLPPEKGIYIFLDFEDKLCINIETSKNTRYNLTLSEDNPIKQIRTILVARRDLGVKRLYENASLPSQETIDAWVKQNSIKILTKLDVNKLQI